MGPRFATLLFRNAEKVFQNSVLPTDNAQQKNLVGSLEALLSSFGSYDTGCRRGLRHFSIVVGVTVF